MVTMVHQGFRLAEKHPLFLFSSLSVELPQLGAETSEEQF